MRVVVGEGAQPVEFFLPGRVPERELDVDIVDEDVVDVIFLTRGLVADATHCWGMGGAPKTVGSLGGRK